jgi:hypothetical protein
VRDIALRVAAVGSLVAALYHATALVVPAFAAVAYPPDYPAIRHIVFIAIDGSFAWLLIRRPPWLVWPYLILAIQVLSGHGRSAWEQWQTQRTIDWVSVFVSIGVPLTLALLIADRRSRPKGLRYS